jgi:AmiR/NasT family two-component response regulator
VDEASRNRVLMRSREVRQESARIGAHRAEICEWISAERRRSLLVTTAATDAEVSGHPVMLARLDRLSTTLGRSPEIEQAKAMIAARYGVTRGQAFDILRRISSRTNRKLRDVAADVAQGRPLAGGPSGSAPLSHG